MSQSHLYNELFFTNVLRILGERGMTREQLSELSGVSASLISDLSRGKGNPSLRTMGAIAEALDTALPVLLEATDLGRETLDRLAGDKALTSLPDNYERVTLILTAFEAFVAKKQDEVNRKKLLEMNPGIKSNKP